MRYSFEYLVDKIAFLFRKRALKFFFITDYRGQVQEIMIIIYSQKDTNADIEY